MRTRRSLLTAVLSAITTELVGAPRGIPTSRTSVCSIDWRRERTCSGSTRSTLARVPSAAGAVALRPRWRETRRPRVSAKASSSVKKSGGVCNLDASDRLHSVLARPLRGCQGPVTSQRSAAPCECLPPTAGQSPRRSCAHEIARVLRRLAHVSSDDTLDFYLFTIHLQLGPILPAFPLIINLETRIHPIIDISLRECHHNRKNNAFPCWKVCRRRRQRDELPYKEVSLWRHLRQCVLCALVCSFTSSIRRMHRSRMRYAGQRIWALIRSL